MNVIRRIESARFVAYKEAMKPPNRLYIGQETYDELMSVLAGLVMVTVGFTPGTPADPQETIFGLQIIRVERKHHLAVAYSADA